MALSYTSLAGGSSSGAVSNDFTINVGSSGYTSVALAASFPTGSYICTSSLSDATLDIYLINEDGTSAGYANATTAVTTISATKTFNKVVIYGATNNDTLAFQFKYVFSANATSSSDFLAVAPKVTSASVTSLPNKNDTTVISGFNFASDVEVYFTGTGYSSTAAKSVTRNSSTSLTVTRPDNLPTTGSPYTITVNNPGIASPTSSNSHILSNAITVGSAPVWVTSATLSNFTKTVSYSQAVVATDSDGGSSIAYSVVSGSLPDGITFNTSTGTFSGTPTANTSTPYSYTVRATDSGGNFVDRAFSISQVIPDAPTIGTATDVGTNRAYNNGAASVTFTAPSYVGTSSITSYTVTASTGQTASGASSPIVVTGIATGAAPTFTVTATNSSGTSLSSGASSSVTITTVPQAPTIGTVTSSSNTVASIQFTAGATGGKAISSYTTTSSPSISLSTTGTSSPLSVSGTYVPGTSYQFQIYAVNANGTSAASSLSSGLVVFVANYGATPLTFNSSGTYTVSSGKNLIAGFIYSGGGGGSGGSNGSDNRGGSGGAGGGSGAVLAFKDYPVTPGSNFAITIGGGGSGGSGVSPGSPVTAGNGSAASIGNIFVSNGGGGANNDFTNGSTAGGGGGVSSNANANVIGSRSVSGAVGARETTSSSGGSGSAGSTNTTLSINLNNLGVVNAAAFGSGGGGGAGAYLSGAGGSGTGGSGGSGGTNAGNGGAGGGFNNSNSPPATNVANIGNAGSQPGSGGGGGGGASYKRSVEQSAGVPGGNGFQGRIVIYEA